MKTYTQKQFSKINFSDRSTKYYKIPNNENIYSDFSEALAMCDKFGVDYSELLIVQFNLNFK